MEQTLNPQIISNLAELHTMLLEEEHLDKTLERITGLVCRSLEGCDSAGMTLLEDSKPTTAAATDEFTLQIDAEQFTSGQGPCLSALNEHEVFVVADTRTEDRWPPFIQGAREKGLRSSLSIPIPLASPQRGALNLYSRTPNSFDETSQQIAELFADQAAVAISNAQIYGSALTLTKQLTEAVKSREVIGEAMGILIERENVTQEQAFEMLKKASQQSNVKLREIAERVVHQAVENKKKV